jgi:hypothetical protein
MTILSYFVENLNITDVHQDSFPRENRMMKIHFKIDDFDYYIGFFKHIDNKYRAHKVYHAKDKECKICLGLRGMYCNGFDPYVDELFDYLIHRPELRLTWLYLPYDVKN